MSEKQHQEESTKISMAERVWNLAAIVITIAAVAGWQYSKYANGYSVYRIFGHYGGIVIAASSVAVVIFAIIAVMREK